MAPPPPPPLQEPVILTGIGTDAVNTFEDLSGLPLTCRGAPLASAQTPKNPYDALIEACDHDPANIQKAYQTHRTTRNANQCARLLADDFAGVTVDPILRALPSNPDADPRNCLVFWARPPSHVMDLIAHIQSRLAKAAPNIWLMPRDNLHLTVLEIIHSTTKEFVEVLVERMRPSLEGIVNHARDHRARLVKPLLSFDAAALAVSFVPAAGKDGDEYTYHHLRRDFYRLSKNTNVGVTSRYIVPSAHITIARFVTAKDHELEDGAVDREAMQKWMKLVWEINEEIQNWEGEWIVGQERGVDCRKGRLWYGGGETVVQAEGF